MAKFTDVDVDELVTAIRREAGKFAILTGAGCSIEAKIPSGTQIASEICDAYPLETSSLDKNEKKDYGLCMARIPFAKRKQIIDSHLNSEKVKINWANIALARLIDKKFISRVLTFNFDSILTRSCGLLGKYPATYDFGVAPWAKTKHLAEPCIIHLHGQGSGSAMMNTAEETRKHAEALQPLLKDTFERFPLIVIGYSGCSDQVFPKIKELYDGEQSLYWLGHKDDPEPHIAEFFKGNHTHYCKYIGGIDADTFLIQLAQKLDCFPPQVFANPASHLLAEMKDIAPYPLNEADTTDILKNTIERLKKYETALLLNPNQTAVLINNPAGIDASDKTIPAEIQAWALVELGNKHFNAARKSNSISIYEKAVQQFEAAHKIEPDMHEALNNWGVALLELAQLKKEPALFKAGFSKCEAALKIKPNNYQSLNNWGSGLLRLARLKLEPALLDDSIAKFEAALKIKPDYRLALKNWEIAMLWGWNLTKNPEYLEKAIESINQAEKIDPNDCYNGACLAAIKNDEEGCKERLFRAKAAKSLSTRKRLEENDILANMRDKPWFAELLKDL